MSVAYIGEKLFLEEVKATGLVWVARGLHRNVYAVAVDQTGFSLPVCSAYPSSVSLSILLLSTMCGQVL